MVLKDFSTKIISWYQENKRELPWRSESDPYKIWLSEIILQQTRVNQGLPYYYKFVELFPTVSDLALAEETTVLRAWQGLGYYSRARNLHKCAKIIDNGFDGLFPQTFRQLLKLPGIGPYTAAAIASFAFNEKVAVVDGNVYRVLARVYGLYDDIASGKGQKEFQKKADSLISETDPASFNQAMMEFGALHCTPTSPKCPDCIFNVECHAREKQEQGILPVKTKKTKIRKRYFNYLVFSHNHKVYLNARNAKDIWQGLYDFKLLEEDKVLTIEEVINSDLLKKHVSEIEFIDESSEYKHILSHQRIFAKFFTIKLKSPLLDLEEGLQYYTLDQVLDLPKPVLISSYLNDAFFSD